MTKICILAGNAEEAYRWSKTQGMEKDQWFYPKNENELLFHSNFHVIVVGTAGQNVPASYFEKVYQLALKRGKIGRI